MCIAVTQPNERHVSNTVAAPAILLIHHPFSRLEITTGSNLVAPSSGMSLDLSPFYVFLNDRYCFAHGFLLLKCPPPLPQKVGHG